MLYHGLEGPGVAVRRRKPGWEASREVHMDRNSGILFSSAVFVLGVALTSRGAAPAAEVSDLKVTIREWDVPTKGAHPHDPAVGLDGALWFTEQMANKLGRLDPTTGQFKEYSLEREEFRSARPGSGQRRKHLVYRKLRRLHRQARSANGQGDGIPDA